MNLTALKPPERKSRLPWLGLGLLALACAWVVLRNSPTSAPPAQPTAAVVQITASSTRTAQTTHTAGPTNTLSPTYTPKPTRTATPTVPPSPSPTRAPLPTVPRTSARLALHPPSPDGLFQALTLAVAQDAYRGYETGDVALDLVDSVEGYAVDQLVAADVQRHYADGLPLGTAALHARLDVWFSPSSALMQILRASAIQYVLDHPDLMVNRRRYDSRPMSLRPQLLEMDGDSGREWLVNVDFSQYWLQDWLVFDERAAGVLTPLVVPWKPYYTGQSGVVFDATHDFTGDGRSEIVIARFYYGFGNASGELSVYHAHAGQWQSIGSAYLAPVGFRSGQMSDFALEDVNNDGRADLRVTTPMYLDFGCSYDKIEDYHWNGRELALATPGIAPPDTAACLLAAARTEDNSVVRIQAIEHVLPRLEAENALPDVLAWARVDLAMRYAAEGRTADAISLLETASQARGRGGYLTLLKQAIAEAGSEPRAVCEWLFTRALEAADAVESLQTDVDDVLAPGYPAYPEPWPEYACPLRMLNEALLRRVHLPANQSPAEALAPLGFTFDPIRPLALDADAELEWVGRLASADGRLAVFDQAGGNWSVSFSIEAAPPEAVFGAYFPVGAAQADLLLAAPVAQANVTEACQAGTAQLQFMRLAAEPAGWRTIGRRWQCADTALLKLDDPSVQAQVIALLDETSVDTSAGRPPWLRLEGFTGNVPADTDLFEYLDLLQADILARRRPFDTQSAITALLDFLPASEPAAQRVAARLLYLRGLGYELAGASPRALAAYERLLDQAPNTLWAWLAWARVEPG